MAAETVESPMIKSLRMSPILAGVLLTCLCGAALTPALDAADFLFSWEASADPAVSAYGIYQRSAGSAYSKIDEVRVADLNDPARPSYRVTGLEDGSTYWFAATSISSPHDESDLHDQTCITVNGQVVDCTDDDDDNNGTTVIVSCFISAARGRLSQKATGR
jgi:hypothetical protein